MTSAPLIRIDENPIPDGFETTFLAADDGGQLRMATYPHPNARGTILVHPGWAEFIEKYVEVAEDLHRRGFNVVVCDPRGQGYSQRVQDHDDRGLIVDFRRFTSDFEIFFGAMEGQFSGPYFILAHSMGGLIALDWLARGNQDRVDGVTLSGPLTRLFASRAKRWAVRAITKTGIALGAARRPLFAVPEHSMKFESNNLTQDRFRHARFKALQLGNPEATAGPPKFCWLNAAMEAMARLREPGALSGLKERILLVSADWDETVDPTHHRILAASYPVFDLVRVAGARHEILMEKDIYRDQFWTAFDHYMDSVVASE